MSIDENKQLVLRYIEEVVNTGIVDEIEQYVSPDYTEIYQGKRYPMGIEGAREHILGVRQTYPDLKVTVEQQIAEGEWVATLISAQGTHSGDWLGIKPTGKVLTFTGINIDRVVNDRIAEHSGAANMLEPLLEAGAVRIARSA